MASDAESDSEPGFVGGADGDLVAAACGSDSAGRDVFGGAVGAGVVGTVGAALGRVSLRSRCHSASAVLSAYAFSLIFFFAASMRRLTILMPISEVRLSIFLCCFSLLTMFPWAHHCVSQMRHVAVLPRRPN